MRVVFMGTPEFAVPSLRALAAHYDVVAVYTRPDAISGRGGAPRPNAVKSVALELGIAVTQPRTLRDPSAQAELQSLDADLIVVAAYGLILPREALDAARLGVVNVHASLLPRWRGAAPIQRAILAGDAVTGVSIMRMEEGLDTGPYCLQRSYELAGRSAREATAALALIGAEALIDALPAIETGTAEWVTQDDSQVTYAEKVAKPEVAVDPSLTVSEMTRRILASMPASPSRVTLAGRGATLLDAHVTADIVDAGRLACTRSGLLLGALDGAVEVRRVKPDGKAEMDACAWARGVRDLDRAVWSAPS